MGAKSERRGQAFGNARGKERQKRRREARLANPRVASALAEAREHQAAIDAAAEAGVQLGRPKLVYVKEHQQVPDQRDEASSVGFGATPPRASVIYKLKIDWNLRDVYLMIHQGYQRDQINRRTKGQYEDILDSLMEEVDDAEDES